MKTNYFFSVFFLAFSLIIFNCSGDDNEDGGGNQITSVSVSSNISSQEVNNTFIFTATANTGSNITSTSTFKVNGNAISGNTFTPATEGSYTINATYGTFTSSQITIIATAEEQPITSIALSANATTLTIGENFVFTVTGNNGEDVSSSSALTVDGADIPGISYLAATVGTFTAQATYDVFTSNELSITVLPTPIVFTKNVLIEDYTGAWCGYCPRVAYGIELVEAQTTRAIPVAIHRGTSSGSYYDPFSFDANVLEDMINLQGYPTAMLNRTTEWNFPEPNNVSQVVNMTGDDAELGLAINSTLSGTDMYIDVSVKFGSDFSSEALKLVVYLLEDDLILNQVNYTSYYGGADPIVNFEHDNVLRTSLTNLLGDAIPSGDTGQEDIYTTNFSLVVPSNISDSSKVSVVAFIINSSNGAINSRVSHLGDTQNFEEN